MSYTFWLVLIINNGFGYNFFLPAASQTARLPRLVEEINEGKTKLLLIAFNLIFVLKIE
ncbi:hypothetical protein V5097_18300 [Arenibacter palladensis]|uniref:hypothetical protein n=1 Tax=Arenibacter palladensis TaxID=237373 RepID=UPI002FCE9960